MNICFLLSTNATTRTTWGRGKNASSFHNTSSIGRWQVLKQTWKTSQSKTMPLHLQEVAPAMRSAQQLHHRFKEPHSSLPRCSLQQRSCLTSLIVRASYPSGPYFDKATLEKHTKTKTAALQNLYPWANTNLKRNSFLSYAMAANSLVSFVLGTNLPTSSSLPLQSATSSPPPAPSRRDSSLTSRGARTSCAARTCCYWER